MLPESPKRQAPDGYEWVTNVTAEHGWTSLDGWCNCMVCFLARHPDYISRRDATDNNGKPAPFSAAIYRPISS